jgi:hypothetical protein
VKGKRGRRPEPTLEVLDFWIAALVDREEIRRKGNVLRKTAMSQVAQDLATSLRRVQHACERMRSEARVHAFFLEIGSNNEDASYWTSRIAAVRAELARIRASHGR